MSAAFGVSQWALLVTYYIVQQLSSGKVNITPERIFRCRKLFVLFTFLLWIKKIWKSNFEHHRSCGVLSSESILSSNLRTPEGGHGSHKTTISFLHALPMVGNPCVYSHVDNVLASLNMGMGIASSDRTDPWWLPLITETRNMNSIAKFPDLQASPSVRGPANDSPTRI